MNKSRIAIISICILIIAATVYFYQGMPSTSNDRISNKVGGSGTSEAEDPFVIYDANGGINPPVDATPYPPGVMVSVLGPGAMTRTGYKFTGWSTGSSGGTQYDPGDNLLLGTSDARLYAQWERVYNLNFDTQGGTPFGPITLSEGDSTTLPSGAAVSKSQHRLMGWNDGTNSFDPGAEFTMPAGDVTLTAEWERVYTLTIDSNGGISPIVTTKPCIVGEKTTLPDESIVINPGFKLKGWIDPTDGKLYVPNAEYDMPASDVTLSAEWSALHTLTFDANGSGGAVPAPQSHADGDDLTLPGQGDLTRDGYTFNGWNTTADGTGTHYDAESHFVMGASNVTLYAEWVQFSVTYDGNGAGATNIPVDAQKYKDGSTVTVLHEPDREDYKFKGWDTKKEGDGNRYDPGETFKIGKYNVTLYAQWEKEESPTPPASSNHEETVAKHTLTYDGNGSEGGTVPAGSQEYKEGADIKVLGNAGNLARTGYTFTGWSTTTNKGGVSYSEGSTLTMGKSNVTLYAQWTEDMVTLYTLKYDGNGSESAIAPIGDQKYESGTRVQVLGNPGEMERKGYTFTGWNTKPDGSGAFYKAGSTFEVEKSNATLYAQWEKSSVSKPVVVGVTGAILVAVIIGLIVALASRNRKA